MNLRCRSTAAGLTPVGLLPVILPVILCVLSPASLHAAIDDSVPAPAYIAQLEQRAAQAKPREQCFLYAELVHGMTQIASKQLLEGDSEAASATLTKINHYAQLIHASLANDTKKLKDAEMLMQHTTFHFGMFLRSASSDDRMALQATLTQLDHVHDEMLNQVFSH